MADRRSAAAVFAVTLLCLSACGGSSPTSPTPRTCTPIVGVTSPTLVAGDLLRFNFRVPGGANAEVMFVFAGEGGSGLSRATVAFRLYDGAALLGTLDNYHDTVGIFRSPESSFGSPGSGVSAPTAVADFRTIVNGTIDGRVEYVVSQGSLSVDHMEKATVMLINPLDLNPIGNPVITARELCR